MPVRKELGGSKGYIRRIPASGDPIRNGFLPDNGMPPASVYCAHLLDKKGNISFFGRRLYNTFNRLDQVLRL